MPKYSVPTEDFKLDSADGEITLQLRGLSAHHIATLVRSQGDVMEELYSKAVDGTDLTAADTEALTIQLLDEAPILVGLAISFGIGEEDFWDDALEIPFSDQVAIIERVIALTFKREGGMGKVVGIIKSAMAATVGPLRTARAVKAA